MQCLIIQQPYASLIAFGHKRWEFRSYETKPKAVIGIAASPSSILGTHNDQLNLAARTFPRGVILATAELVTSFYITNKDLAGLISDTVEVNIHGNKLRTLPEPIGEPIEDVKLAATNPNWSSYAWQLDKIKILKEPVPFQKISQSTWVNVEIPMNQ